MVNDLARHIDTDGSIWIAGASELPHGHNGCGFQGRNFASFHGGLGLSPSAQELAAIPPTRPKKRL